ncbi:MAG: tRNA (guanosine(46)-N7)-methyltransferase TrmB [Rubellimicrobium sp.]|nr:tRNA (guanosine(46)-N7)-methyltransferase TrmB [Rubellimicrobium sp.]
MNAPDDPAGPNEDRPERSWRNFYGRRHGKALRPRQRAHLASDLAALSPGPVGYDENPDRRPLDLATRFGGRPVWLEIGFGGGEHMVHMAARYPDIGLIGAEPFINGVAMLLGRIREAGVTNLAVHAGDVRDLFDVLPAGSVTRAFLNYPDPWPKTRHHRRRFVTPGYLVPLARVLAPGAELRVATDIADYVRQALEEVPPAGFRRLEHPDDRPWGDWPSTRYEQKALREGRRPHYLTFHRLGPSAV